MNWRGEKIVDISREFLDTNGAHQTAEAFVEIPDVKKSLLVTPEVKDWRKGWLERLSDLNECSQQGLVERFDSSIGAGNVLMPYGGKNRKTESQCMVHKLPVQSGKCDTVTMMSYGFDPYIFQAGVRSMVLHGVLLILLRRLLRPVETVKR